MVLASHSDHLEDSRFIELGPVDYQLVPKDLLWFADQEDYLTDELIGVRIDELKALQDASERAFQLFKEATSAIIADRQLGELDIPEFMWPMIEYTWSQRNARHPFLYGRFDIIGGIADDTPPKVIEFNADTCTMVPETLLWQPLHLSHEDGEKSDFNHLKLDLKKQFRALKGTLSDERPVILGTSLGHPEDRANIAALLNVAAEMDQFFVYYRDLQEVVFAEDGVYLEEGRGYIKADVLLKLFPWDWAYTEEPNLAKELSELILSDKVQVLSPPYTTIWQNKIFLNYITDRFPNDVIAKSYDQPPKGAPHYVAKSSHGRLGEEVQVVNYGKVQPSNFTIKTYQEYLPLPTDNEGYSYQLGMFVTDKSSALNIRGQEGKVINDDCEFYCHYLMG